MKPLFLAIAVAAFPVLAVAEPARTIDFATQPSARRVQQQVLDQDARVLQQIKTSVCGPGPFYAGAVDDPVFVQPRFRPTCTISATRPDPRRDP